MPTISVCMIVKNEAHNLKNLLPVLKHLADEVIVVDTGSTDNTDLVMQDAALRMYGFPWCEDFSKARNESLKYATKDYIMWVDADDAIQEEDFVALRKHLEENPDTAVMMKLVDLRPNNKYVSDQLRVFPNNKGVEFRGRIHEQVIDSINENKIPVTYCDAKVYHLGYQDSSLMAQKLVRNTILLEKELEDNPDNYFQMLALSRTYLSIGNNTKSLELVDRIIKENKGSKETYVEMAYLVKASALDLSDKRGDAIGILKEGKEVFPKNEYFDIQLGEFYFNNKMYKKTFECLKKHWGGDWVDKKSVFPVDTDTLLNTVRWQALVSSLAVGELKTTQLLMQRILDDKSFKIGGSR